MVSAPGAAVQEFIFNAAEAVLNTGFFFGSILKESVSLILHLRIHLSFSEDCCDSLPPAGVFPSWVPHPLTQSVEEDVYSVASTQLVAG